jgi:hypothetical protein
LNKDDQEQIRKNLGSSTGKAVQAPNSCLQYDKLWPIELHFSKTHFDKDIKSPQESNEALPYGNGDLSVNLSESILNRSLPFTARSVHKQ